MAELEHADLSSYIVPDGINGKGTGISLGTYYTESFLLRTPGATAEEIREHLEETTGRHVGPGTVYATLERLRKEGKIEVNGRGWKNDVKKYSANEGARQDVLRAKLGLLDALAIPDGFAELLREEAERTRQARENLEQRRKELQFSDDSFQDPIESLAMRERELLDQANLLESFQRRDDKA